MVDLKAKPYFLSDEDIQWVRDTIAGMSVEEKVGQLFFAHGGKASEEELLELVQKYHIGGYRYNGIPAAQVQKQVRVLQTGSRLPLFVACNTEAGGNGSGADGTYIASGIKIGATRKPQFAFDMARLANEEAAPMGNNMAFAPVCDIHYNWENTEIVSRAFGSDVDRVAEMSRAYMDGVHAVPGFASVAKHFPGNGQDFRDAHISNNVNEFTREEWMATYGKVYKTLIDGGLDGIMGGHIMLPKYMREVKPGIQDEDILPATLCYEVMTGLLRDELGFNGMVVTDATHMVGMTDRMKRRDMVVATVNAGCDMILFFNDADEDFAAVRKAYESGVITEERMTEALTRILGLKAKLGLNKKAKEDIVPAPEALEAALRKPEYTAKAAEITKEALTLVKYKDQGVLPVTPAKYPRVMIVPVKGNDGGMGAFAKMMGMGGGKSPAEELCERLNAKGFQARVYEDPMKKAMEALKAGKPFDIYHAGKSSVADFVGAQDLVITLFDVQNGRPSFGMSLKGGGEIPWYVHELPVIGISVNSPTMLADAPMLRTYINTYDSKPYTLDALVEALMAGPEAFKGQDPIDSFCGLWDTRI